MKKAKTLKQGAIRAMFDRANTMTGVISLGIGEPDMPTPKLVCEACKEALDKGITHYTPNAGTLSFRQAIAEKSYLKDLHYDPNTEIIITNGGMGALSLLFLILLNKGDEILIQDPQWLNYVAQVAYCDGTAVRVPTDLKHNFEMQAGNHRKAHHTAHQGADDQHPEQPHRLRYDARNDGKDRRAGREARSAGDL